MEMHDEIRIEMRACELFYFMRENIYIDSPDFKLNNVIIGGYKDIGLDGWITFILRKQEAKHGASEEVKDRTIESEP